MASPRDIVRWTVGCFANPRHAVRVLLTLLLYRPWFVRACDAVGGVPLLSCLATITIDSRDVEAGAPQVLVLDRLYFTKDVAELTKRGRLSYAKLQTHVLSTVQANWLPMRLCEQIQYAPRTGPQDAAAWEKCNRFGEDVLRQWRKTHAVVAVLASNVDYWQHESFRNACRKLGIPFLVLCQEVQTLPFTYAYSIALYRDANFRFGGTAVAVFERKTADMLIESGCCTADQVVVTGAPRLDPWFDPVETSPKRSFLTLLAFDGEQYFAPRAYLDSLKAFAEQSLANTDADLSYVVKCKDAEDLARAETHLIGVGHRLVLSHAWPLPDLLARSRLVMGYNSLALLEALLSEALIVVPQWGDAARAVDEQNVDPLDPHNRSEFEFLPDVDSLRRALQKAAASEIPVSDRARRLALFRRWFYLPPDLTATNAVENFIADRVARAGLQMRVATAL